MSTFSKELLSGSTGGRLIQVAATSTPGTTIHATGTSATIIDEIWLYAVNVWTADVKLTLEYGGTTGGNQIEFTVPAESGLYLVVPGLVLTGDGASASTITAFGSLTNSVNIGGYVNRISP